MERRSFLTLLASAPLAALVPWTRTVMNGYFLSFDAAPSTVRFLEIYDEQAWVTAWKAAPERFCRPSLAIQDAWMKGRKLSEVRVAE